MCFIFSLSFHLSNNTRFSLGINVTTSVVVIRGTIATLVTRKVKCEHNVNGQQPGIGQCGQRSTAPALWDSLEAE